MPQYLVLTFDGARVTSKETAEIIAWDLGLGGGTSSSKDAVTDLQ